MNKKRLEVVGCEDRVFYEDHLSCIGNPCTTFFNSDGVRIGYGSYDKVDKVLGTATGKQKVFLGRWLKKSENSVFFKEIGNFMNKLLSDVITVGADKDLVLKDLEYWMRANF